MFNTFPKISGVKKNSFVKGQYVDIEITIEAFLFGLDWWF